MPMNSRHDAIARILEILKKLPTRSPGITAKDMMLWLQEEGFECTKRTVERDLLGLEEHFPLLCNKKGIPFGWYWMPGFALDLPGLTVADAMSLHLVEDLLRPLLPEAVLESLKPRFLQARKKLAALTETNPNARWLDKVRHVPPTLPLLPPKIADGVLDAVQDALLADRQLEVVYQRPDADEPQNLRLHPLGLVQRGPVTYLVATVFDYTEVRIFAVHRIQEAKGLTAPAQRSDGFSLDEYINHGALQFGEGKFIKLKVSVSDFLAKMLTETPLSEDMKIFEKSGEFVLTCTVADTWQLHWWILSWGEEIEVMAPKGLRKTIIDKIQRAGAIYNQG